MKANSTTNSELNTRGSVASRFASGVALLALVFSFGCNYQVKKTGAIGGTGPSDKPGAKDVLSFKGLCEAILDKHCVRCHDDFDDHSKVALPARLMEMRARVLRQHDRPMPPMATMSQREIDTLVAWIDAGAPLEKPQPGDQPSPTPIPTATPEPTPTPLPTPLPGSGLPSFEQLKSYVLNEKCLKCHEEGDEPNLTTYSLFVEWAASTRDRILRPIDASGHMPKPRKPQLTQDELATLVAYIDGGMPENGSGNWQPPQGEVPPTPTPAPQPEPTPTPGAELKPTFASISANIFAPKCVQCHTPPKFAGRIYPLGELAGLLQADLALTTRDVLHSKLIRAVTRTDKGRMPPAKAGEALTQEEVDVLKKWIELGCPQ